MSPLAARQQPRLYFVRGIDNEVVSLGKRQAEFLLEQGHIRPDARQAYLYHARTHTSTEVNAIVLSYAELRECDFCGTSPAGWRVNCEPFTLHYGPNAGATMGGSGRPVFACSECVPYLRTRDRRRLTEHMMDARIEQARQLGALRVSKSEARRHVRPMTEDITHQVIDNMTGEPEED